MSRGASYSYSLECKRADGVVEDISFIGAVLLHRSMGEPLCGLASHVTRMSFCSTCIIEAIEATGFLFLYHLDPSSQQCSRSALSSRTPHRQRTEL
jgi:hypothetical protein